MNLETLSHIKSNEFKTYFESVGWNAKVIEDKTVMKSPGSNSSISFLLPPGPEFDDNNIRVYEAIRAFSDYSGETVYSCYQNLTNMIGTNFQSVPTINFRLNVREHGHRVAIGTLENVLENTYRLIAHTISNELDTPIPWRLKPLSKASELAREFEFGQTGQGSFIARVSVPQKNYLQQQLFKNSALNLEERAILRLINGLNFANELSTKTNDQIIQSIDAGLNANMASAMSRIMKSTISTGAEISFDTPRDSAWNKKEATRKFVSSLGIINSLDHIEKVLIDTSKSQLTLRCWVIGVKGKLHKQDSMIPTLTLEIDDKLNAEEDLQGKRFSIDVSQEQFKFAQKAYNNRRALKVSGIFEYEKQRVAVKKLSSIK